MGRYNHAGLPEIAGSLGRTASDSKSQTTGAFEQTGISSAVLNAATNGSILAYMTTFSAEKANSIYGLYDTVMPASADMIIGLYLGRTA